MLGSLGRVHANLQGHKTYPGLVYQGPAGTAGDADRQCQSSGAGSKLVGNGDFSVLRLALQVLRLPNSVHRWPKQCKHQYVTM